MIQRIRDARENESGFTLIELLIVIVVLGILAGIVVFGVGTFRADSKTAACAANEKTVEVAAEAYNAKTGGYPATGVVDATHVLVTGKYLKDVPVPAVTLTAGDATTATC